MGIRDWFGKRQSGGKSAGLKDQEPGDGMRERTCQVRNKLFDAFSIRVSDQLPSFLDDWIGNWLKAYAEGGAEIRDGQTLQVGFWRLDCKVANRRLSLLAPRPGTMPIEMIEDLSAVLRSMMLHKYIPESFDLPMNTPGMLETATVGRLFSERPMFMNRLERLGDGPDSGWFFGSMRKDIDNNDPGQLSVMTLYEASLRAPWIHEFLSLPVGTQVMFDADRPVVCRDFTPIHPRPGSYVAEQETVRDGDTNSG